MKFNVLFITLVGLVSPMTASAQESSIGYVREGNFDILGGQYQSEVTITELDATFIKVHFNIIHLNPGAYITVSSPDGAESHRYPEEAPSSTPVTQSDSWALSIDGSTAVVTLHADDLPGNIVHIDRYVVGEDAMYTESTCGGGDDMRRAACYRSSNPTIFDKAKAVAKIVIVKSGGTFSCTAWRVGPRNDTMMTNNHCISNQNHANNTEVQFRYQQSTCEGSEFAGTVKVRANRLLVTNGPTDMTLFTINNPERVARFGALELENRNPRAREEIYIPQHARGWAKRIGVVDGGRNCAVNWVSSGASMNYRCDTQQGSSGSPVISRSSHRVIALHNAGGCSANGGNHGHKVRSFFNLVSSHLNNSPGGGGGSGGDTSPSPSNPAPGCNSTHYIRCGDRCFTAEQAASEPMCQ